MKRGLLLIIAIALAINVFLALRERMPFMAMYGTSMVPALNPGDLIFISPISPSEIKEGDIIVYSLPEITRETFGYPNMVAHRVVGVDTTTPEPKFRTRGDNTPGEDPFMVMPEDVRGKVSRQFPLLGFPILFLQSRQGLFFIIIALSLFAFHLYSQELGRGTKKAHRGLFAPVIEESRRTSQVLERRIASTEKGMVDTQQALEKFASAIAVYAEHLKSHTSAIQGLSEASQELKRSAAEQSKVLIRLMEVMGPGAVKTEKVIPRVEEVAPKVEQNKVVTDLMETMEQTAPEEEEVAPKIERAKFPPGCIRSRQQPVKEDKIF